MPIIFRSAPFHEPFTFDSLGNHWLQDPVSRPNGYPFYHYLQTETGTGRVKAGGKTYLLREGEGILLAPFTRHSYSRESEDWYTLFASFTGTVESVLPRIMDNRAVILTGKDQGKRIAALIDDCMSLCGKHPLDERALSVNCYSILMSFVDGIHTGKREKDPLYRRYVAPVIEEIESSYSLDLSVEDLSRKVFITPQYLSRLFRRFLGCSTYEYLTSFRISRAKELLITDIRLEVQDISRQTGFSDPSHFIAVFRRITGMTPLEFRRLNRAL